MDSAAAHSQRVCSVFLYPANTLPVSGKQCQTESVVLLLVYISWVSYAEGAVGHRSLYRSIRTHIHHHLNISVQPNTVLLDAVRRRHQRQVHRNKLAGLDQRRSERRNRRVDDRHPAIANTETGTSLEKEDWRGYHVLDWHIVSEPGAVLVIARLVKRDR